MKLLVPQSKYKPQFPVICWGLFCRLGVFCPLFVVLEFSGLLGCFQFFGLFGFFLALCIEAQRRDNEI